MSPARPEITGRAAFSVNEFCARWGISRATFYEEVKAGRIDARKVRDKTIITVEADDDYRKNLVPLKRQPKRIAPSDRVRRPGRPRKQSAP